MGLMAQFDHSDYRAVISKILNLSNENHIPTGIHIVNPIASDLKRSLDEGYRFIAYSIDTVLLNTAAKFPKID